MTVTFTAVPGLAYDSGAPAFFAVPYTVIVCPLAFVLLSRLWAVARRHRYVMPPTSCADAEVRRRWCSWSR